VSQPRSAGARRSGIGLAADDADADGPGAEGAEAGGAEADGAEADGAAVFEHAASKVTVNTIKVTVNTIDARRIWTPLLARSMSE
jgi:hypothetical protein